MGMDGIDRLDQNLAAHMVNHESKNGCGLSFALDSTLQ